MQMVVPNEGKLELVAFAFAAGGSSLGTALIYLYTNDYTPVDGSVASNFTAPTFTGGGNWPITGADWAGAVLVGDVGTNTLTTPPTWVNTGVTTETCYGWVMTNASSGKALLAQRFDTPRVMAPGASESLDPFTVQLKSIP